VIAALPAAVALAATDPPSDGIGTAAVGAPETRIDAGPRGPTSDASPSFAFSSPQPTARFACSLDAAPFAPCSSPRAFTKLPDGAHTFRVRASDASDGADPTPASSTFAVDTAPPTVSIESGPAGVVSNPLPTFTFASDDDSATFTCSLRPASPTFAPCPADGQYEPPAPLQNGGYTFGVRATDPAGNSAAATRRFTVGAEAAEPAGASGPTGATGETGQATETSTSKMARFKRSAPQPVPAWYMTARSERDLRRQARNDACAFARRQSNRTRVLLMDFGKPSRHHGALGTQLRTGAEFANQDILDALKAAADAYRTNGKCYSRGSARITYGNTNNMPNWMSRRNIRKAGRHQSRMSDRLHTYQRRHGRHYRHEGVAVASDVEPQWNKPKATKALVHGAIFHRRGGLFFNYGAASKCPPERSRCANKWSLRNLGQVSYGGIKRALPEVYRRVHAKQWTRVRKRWNNQHRYRYCFSGTTSTPGFPLSSREGWAKLRTNNRCVRNELVNIREQ